MKKLIALTTLATLSFSAFADTSATLLLKGVIGDILEVSVAPETVATNLNLNTSFSDLKVARVTSKTNRFGGLKLYVSSANGGKLNHDVDTNSYVDYSLKYENTQVALNKTPSLVTTYTSKGTNAQDIKMTVSSINPNLSAGTYQDTVTFSVVAN